jgi:phosphopantothenoylcysteine synthetase/decarboxylase
MLKIYADEHLVGMPTNYDGWMREEKTPFSLFSGEAGLRIACAFRDRGCQVTPLMGPSRAQFTEADRHRMSVRNFLFYEELDALLATYLEQTTVDIVAHSAAVADYRPTDPVFKKTRSDCQHLDIELSPTPKLVLPVR